MSEEQTSAARDAKRMTRISVVRDRHLVPLLPSAQDGGAGDQPWKDLLLEQHAVLPGEIPEHSHPELCLHLQLSGSEDFEWWSAGEHAVERTRPGSLILIPPGTTDRLRWTGRSERLILSVRQEVLGRLAEEAGGLVKPEFQPQWALEDGSLRNLVSEMGREARDGWPLGGLYADLLALGFATRLLRTHAASRVEFPVRRGGLALPKLRRAMEYMNANLAEEVRLEAVARELELSASHFAHEFRNSTGKTAYQYLLDQRIRRAKEMLKRTRWTVQYIGAAVGFKSSVNFVRAFRERVGCTPEAWRKSAG